MPSPTKKPTNPLDIIDRQFQHLQKDHHLLRTTMTRLTHLYASMEEEQEISSSPSHRSSLKPNYLKMSDKILQEKLITFSTIGAAFIEKCDTSKKMDYLRYYLHLSSESYCLQYQENLWKNYSTMSILIFTRRMNLTKEFTQENYLNPHVRTICLALHKKPKIIRTQLNHVRDRWYRCLQTYRTMAFSFDMKLFEECLRLFVEKELNQLRTFYLWKKKFFKAQLDDYCLVHSFYDHQPMLNQIRSARLIWQITHSLLQLKGQHALMEQCLHLQQITTTQSTMISSFFNQFSWLPPFSRWKEYRIMQTMKRAEIMMDHYRAMIHMAGSQLREEIDHTPLSTAIRLSQYIDLRSESMRNIAKHIIEWQLVSFNYHQQDSF